MVLKDLQQLYTKHPNTKALAKIMADERVRTIHLAGLSASSAPLVFSGLTGNLTLLHVMNDQEQAGYFYHDLMQVLGEASVLFFPSSYRRAIKYGQRDAANEILRTEVLARLQAHQSASLSMGTLHVVTSPEALAEQVVSRQELSEKTLHLQVGQRVTSTSVQETLAEYGFVHEITFTSRASLPCEAAFLMSFPIHPNTPSASISLVTR